ncbi:MAG: PqqD family protein [Myxococcales bacterium]|nr:PqqD family protein [Myxococcales bacterium]
MIPEQAIPRHNERVAARVIDGKAVVVVIDEKQLHTLNQVGTRVWELCDGRSVGAIAEALVEEFEVEREVALSDVRSFVETLRGLGALEVPEVAS